MTENPTKTLQRTLAAALLVALIPAGSIACFGKFQLLRNVYKFNVDVTPDKWMQWFIFLVLSIVPVYELAFTIDLLLANSIEFWTDENPVKPTPRRYSAVSPDGSLVTLTRMPAGVVAVEIREDGGAVHRFHVTRDGDSLAAHDEAGRLLARVGGSAMHPRLLEGAAVGF